MTNAPAIHQSGDADNGQGAATPLSAVSDITAAALVLADRGLAVFPVQRDKKPLPGSRGFKDASTDPAEVARLFALPGAESVAIATGPASGVWVLDVDLPKKPGDPDGRQTLRDLEDQHGPLPFTWRQRTGSGGRHYFFRWPEGGEPIRNTAGTKLGPRLDVRGEGGYIVAPPSPHPSGDCYAWERGFAPWEMELSDASAWLLEMVRTPAERPPLAIVKPQSGGCTPYGRAALEREAERVRTAPQGQRNHAVNASAFSLGQLVAGGALDRATVEAELMTSARACGLPDFEASRTIASGLNSGMAEPRTARERAEASGGVPPVSIPTAPRMDGPSPFTVADWQSLRVGWMLEQEPPPLKWLFRDRLLSGDLGFLVGAQGVGKSTLCLHMAAAVTTGRDVFQGELVPARRGRVLMVLAEDRPEVVHHRFRKVALSLFEHEPDAQREFADGLLFLSGIGGRLRLVETVMGVVQETQGFRDLLKLAKSVPDLAMIALDPLARLFGGNENDNAAATVFAELLERLGNETGAAVLCTAHVAKGASKGKNGAFDLTSALHMDAMRGASAFSGAARFQVNVTDLPPDYARREMRDPVASRGEYLALRCCKVSNGPPGDPFFLRRKPGGVFGRVLVEKTEEEAAIEDQAAAWVLAEVERREKAGEEPMTARQFGRLATKIGKEIPGVTEASVGRSIEGLCHGGRLHRVSRKGANRKMQEVLATPRTSPN